MKTAAYLLLLTMLLGVCSAYAQENTNANMTLEELDALLEGEVETPVYKYPKIKPELLLSAGYRLVDQTGARSAVDYEYLESSVTLFGEARVFSFPHRYYLVLDLLNDRDYFGDFRYAYKDLVFFRSINRMVFHNISSVTLADLNTATANPGIVARDMGAEYGVKTVMFNHFLRLKTPGFHAHAFFDYWAVDRTGTQQDVSLLGSGYFNNVVRTSQVRDLDWDTGEYTMGVNSHLGPVEAEYAHTEKTFEAEGGEVMNDFYSGNTFRPAGVYPHGLVPDQEGSDNTLRLHTSYSGRLFATATASLKERENSDSGAQADYFVGSGGLMWMPAVNLTFYVKYRHQKVDVDNPATATITDITNPANSFTFNVRKALSSTTDTVSLAARYRPFRKVTLKGKYTYEETSRDNADLWGLRDSTGKNVYAASADMRLAKGLKADINYSFTQMDDPAYNTDPDYSNAGAVSVSWTPSPRVLTYISYNLTHETRDFLSFSGTQDARDREDERGRLMGSGTFIASRNVSITASYAYIYNRIEQDLVYRSLGGTPLIDRGVEYEDKSHSYTLDVGYTPVERVSLQAGVSYARGEGTFTPGSVDLTTPVSIETFTESDMEEMAFSASGEYRGRAGYGVGLSYEYVDVQEKLVNPYDDAEDGDAQTVMVTLSRKW